MAQELLIATNGFAGTWDSIEYGSWLASVIQAKVTLLGVNEQTNEAEVADQSPLEDIFADAVELFQKNKLTYSLEIQQGDAEQIVPRKAQSGEFITVIGPLGRPQLKRWLVGRSFRHLMEHIEKPILYVPQSTLPLKKLLICIGGLGYEVSAEHIAMRAAMNSRAEITLLHIVPPMDLDYPTARIVRENWQKLETTDTPVGRSLRQAMEIARGDGLTANVKARQGNVVEQILAEVKEGNYDMLCMGSPYSTNSLRQMYAPNVTAEIAESANIPLLTARYRRD